jgi:hypothetical protein
MLLLMISIKTFIIESALAKLNSDELIYAEILLKVALKTLNKPKPNRS